MFEDLREVIGGVPTLDFAVLVGSQASDVKHANSDWDIALQWSPGQPWLAVLGATEELRQRLADHLGVPSAKIDLIDLRGANLAMCASVAEEGVPLVGENGLAWARFLQRTWRDLEDYEWEKKHAA